MRNMSCKYGLHLLQRPLPHHPLRTIPGFLRRLKHQHHRSLPPRTNFCNISSTTFPLGNKQTNKNKQTHATFGFFQFIFPRTKEDPTCACICWLKSNQHQLLQESYVSISMLHIQNTDRPTCTFLFIRCNEDFIDHHKEKQIIVYGSIELVIRNKSKINRNSSISCTISNPSPKRNDLDIYMEEIHVPFN